MSDVLPSNVFGQLGKIGNAFNSRILTKPTVTVALGVFVCSGAVGAQSLAGDWKGTLADGARKLPVVFHIEESADDAYLGSFKDADGDFVGIDRIQLNGNDVRFSVRAMFGASFEGTLDATQRRISGTWTQGRSQPMEITRSGEAPPRKAPRPSRIANLTPGAVEALGPLLVLSTGMGPVPFTGGDNRTHLTYELHITNPTAFELHLRRLDVIAENVTVASFEKTELNGLLGDLGWTVLQGLRLTNSTFLGEGSLDRRTIGPRSAAIAFVWLTLRDGAVPPAQLRHRITVDGYTVDGGLVAVSPMSPMVIGPPLRGSDWVAMNGPANESFHRRSLYGTEGNERSSQRFATDWAKVDGEGQALSGDPGNNKNYYSYGNEVLAVADGVVSEAVDGIPENVPRKSPAVRMRLETIFGNNLVLDLGGSRYALYAHLQPGSLRVKSGDPVHRGQVLGLVGNTGNSSGPHLHFQMMDGISPNASEGLPYVLDSYDPWSGKVWEERKRRLPLTGDRVRFP